MFFKTWVAKLVGCLNWKTYASFWCFKIWKELGLILLLQMMQVVQQRHGMYRKVKRFLDACIHFINLCVEFLNTWNLLICNLKTCCEFHKLCSCYWMQMFPTVVVVNAEVSILAVSCPINLCQRSYRFFLILFLPS